MCLYCGIGEHCSTVHANGLSDAEKQEILDKHNELRAQVANGQQDGQPGASNMKKLKWDDELAANGKFYILRVYNSLSTDFLISSTLG